MDVLLVIHIIIVVCLIGVILIQPGSSDGLIAGGQNNAFMSSRASANLLTRTTAILATAFILNSLLLAYIATSSSEPKSLADKIVEEEKKTQETGEGKDQKIDIPSSSSSTPTEPSVPLAE